MPLMYGNDKIVNFPWANEEIARAYWGNDLIYENKPWYSEYGVLADYVISNGVDNWIDTWLSMNVSKDGVIIEMDIEYLNITNTEKNAFGAVSGSGSSRQVVEVGSIVSGKTAFYGYSSNGSWKVTDFNVIENTRYKLRYELRSGLQVMFVDDIEVWRATDTVNLTSSNAMTLFARSYSNTQGGFVKAKWHKFKMSKLDGTPIADYTPLYVSKKPILDRESNIYPIGSYVLVDNVRKEATVLHGAPLDGYINLESEFYFKCISEQNPYYDLGRRIAYGKRIEIPISFEDATINPYPLYGLFGSRQGYSQGTAYNTFIGRNDLPMATDVPVGLIPTDRKFTITIEDGKGYIDGVLTTTDTTPVSDWNQNSFLYNVNTEGLGGPMTTYRLPIGTRVYGCRIYDVATGILENAYLPQEDQTLKCAVTGEILPKLGINPTDSWEVKHTVWWKDYGNRVDYITSDGTAYIDTGYVPQYENGRTELGVNIVNVDSATSIYGFIERSGDLTNRIAIGSTASGLFTGSGNTNYTVSPTEANFKYEIDWDRKTGKTILNGVEYNTPNLGGLTKTYSAYLFSRNDSGKPDANGVYNLAGKVYYLKETLDDVVQLSLIPIQVRETFIDNNNVPHSAGSFIMVNELIEFDVPTHVGEFTGE